MFEVKDFLSIPASAADAAGVNPNGIRIALLTNDLILFFVKGNLVFINGPRSLPRNPPYVSPWVFDSLISVDDLLAKALRRFVTCVLSNIYEK